MTVNTADPPGTPRGDAGVHGTSTTEPIDMSSPGTHAVLPFAPKKPKFGGLKEVSKDTLAAWVGGKPNLNWTGLETPVAASIKANQHRSNGIASEQKARHYRISGLDTSTGNKFTSSCQGASIFVRSKN